MFGLYLFLSRVSGWRGGPPPPLSELIPPEMKGWGVGQHSSLVRQIFHFSTTSFQQLVHTRRVQQLPKLNRQFESIRPDRGCVTSRSRRNSASIRGFQRVEYVSFSSEQRAQRMLVVGSGLSTIEIFNMESTPSSCGSTGRPGIPESPNEVVWSRFLGVSGTQRIALHLKWRGSI